MSAAQLLDECKANGVTVYLSGGDVKVRGSPEIIGRIAPALKERKAEILEHLTQRPGIDLVREFMEADGLTLEEAKELAALSIQPRQASEWLSMIAALDKAIEAWCALNAIPEESQARILQSRARQPLGTIPESLVWFSKEVENAKPRGKEK